MKPVALITGGSRGIGAATAFRAAQQGFAVAVNYTRDADAANAVVRQIVAAGGTAMAVQADVADEAQVLAMYQAIDAQLGRPRHDPHGDAIPAADGSVEFSVTDPMGFAEGAWRVTVADHTADVTPLDAAAVRVDVTALASLYMGLVDASTLAVAGLIEGPADGIDALARLFRTAVPPYSLTGF